MKKKFIYIDVRPWEQYFWRTDILNEMALQGYEVYYFNILKLKEFLREIYMLKFCMKNNLVNVVPIFRVSKKMKDIEIYKIIQKLDAMEVDSNTVVMTPSIEQCLALKAKYNDKIKIFYDILDRYSEYSRKTDHERWDFDLQESKAIQLADSVFCASQKLFIEAKQFNNNSIYFSNAVSPEKFEKFIVQQKHGKVLGAVCNDLSRLNWDLICDIASAFSDYTFEFIGKNNVENKKMPMNIIFRGKLSYEATWEVASRWEVGLALYNMSRFNEYCCPLKIFEYSACDIPIISTEIPEAIYLSEVYPDNLFITKSVEGFSIAIAKIEQNKRTSDYKRIAHENTWKMRATSLSQIITKI